MMRLDKFISETTNYSRKDVERLVRSRSISINGRFPKRRDDKVDENCDVIAIEGHPIAYRKFIYLMLNKPAGYLSATEMLTTPLS